MVFLLLILFVQMRILPDPSLFQSSKSKSSFINLFNSHLSNNYTPGHVKVDAVNDPFLNGAAGAPAVVSAVQQVDTITGIVGGAQAKQMDISNILGDAADAYNVTVSIGSFVHSFTVQATASNAGVADVSTLIKTELDKISIGSGGAISVNALGAATKAFTSTVTTNNLGILGSANVGEFNVSLTTSDNAATFSGTSVYAAGARVNEVNAATGTNTTYALANKVWGDGSTISAATPAAAGDIVKFPGGNFFTAINAGTTSNDVSILADWSDTGFATLATLVGSAGVTSPAVTPGDLVASATVATTMHILLMNSPLTLMGHQLLQSITLMQRLRHKLL